MKIFFLVFVCSTISYANTFAQSTILDSVQTTDEILITPEQMPEFPGGVKALYQFIQKNLTYPVQYTKNGTLKATQPNGTVFVGFVVDNRGLLQNVHVLKGMGKDFDTEAKRLISSMPAWIPGKLNGQSIAIKYSMPIRFVYPKTQ